MPYRLEFSPRAARQFRDLPKDVQRRLKVRIDGVAADPRPPGAEHLSGAVDFFRIRAGDYRVEYPIQDDVLLVLIVRVGHRKDVYRRLLG